MSVLVTVSLSINFFGAEMRYSLYSSPIKSGHYQSVSDRFLGSEKEAREEKKKEDGGQRQTGMGI